MLDEAAAEAPDWESGKPVPGHSLATAALFTGQATIPSSPYSLRPEWVWGGGGLATGALTMSWLGVSTTHRAGLGAFISEPFHHLLGISVQSSQSPRMPASTLPKLSICLRKEPFISWEKEQEDSSLAPGGSAGRGWEQRGVNSSCLERGVTLVCLRGEL